MATDLSNQTCLVYTINLKGCDEMYKIVMIPKKAPVAVLWLHDAKRLRGTCTVSELFNGINGSLAACSLGFLNVTMNHNHAGCTCQFSFVP